jgi:hypothetical protein
MPMPGASALLTAALMGKVIGRRDSGVGPQILLFAPYGYPMQPQPLHDSGARPERGLDQQQAVRRVDTGHVTDGP